MYSSSYVGGIIIYSENRLWLWAMVTFRKSIFYLNVGRTQPWLDRMKIPLHPEVSLPKPPHGSLTMGNCH